MTHGVVVNPAGGNWPNPRGLRDEFLGDEGDRARMAAFWLGSEMMDRCARGYRLLYIRPLFGWERDYSMPMLNAENTTPDKLRNIRIALRAVANRYKGTTFCFHCSVRSDTSSFLPTIKREDPIPAEYHSEASIQARFDAWEPLREEVVRGGGKFAVSLDDGAKWPAHTALIRTVAAQRGIEVFCEPPLAYNDEDNTPHWMSIARSVPGIAGPSWTNHLLQNDLPVPPGNAPVYLWWTSAHAAMYGLDGLQHALSLGYRIFNDTKPQDEPEIEALLTGG